jgi:hypothetical protein
MSSRDMVKHPIKLPLLKASDSSRSRDHDRRIKSEICAVKEMSAVKLNQISEKTRSKFLLLVKKFLNFSESYVLQLWFSCHKS